MEKEQKKKPDLPADPDSPPINCNAFLHGEKKQRNSLKASLLLRRNLAFFRLHDPPLETTGTLICCTCLQKERKGQRLKHLSGNLISPLRSFNIHTEACEFLSTGKVPVLGRFRTTGLSSGTWALAYSGGPEAGRRPHHPP